MSVMASFSLTGRAGPKHCIFGQRRFQFHDWLDSQDRWWLYALVSRPRIYFEKEFVRR